MSFISLISLTVAILIWAAIPGPGVFATVARSLASGLRPALAVVIGIVAGDVVYLTFAIFGLSVIAHSMGSFFFVVKIALKNLNRSAGGVMMATGVAIASKS
jgi:threonine/homoserine/homoserine lactone efflux protein